MARTPYICTLYSVLYGSWIDHPRRATRRIDYAHSPCRVYFRCAQYASVPAPYFCHHRLAKSPELRKPVRSTCCLPLVPFLRAPYHTIGATYSELQITLAKYLPNSPTVSVPPLGAHPPAGIMGGASVRVRCWRVAGRRQNAAKRQPRAILTRTGPSLPARAGGWALGWKNGCQRHEMR